MTTTDLAASGLRSADALLTEGMSAVAVSTLVVAGGASQTEARAFILKEFFA